MVRVLARITTLPAEESGQSAPIFSGVRPNHNFGSAEANEFFIGQVQFIGREKLAPGETCDAEIMFIPGPGLDDFLVEGRAWRLQFGSRLIATAIVLSRLD